METEMIDKLDVFISGGMGDAKYRHLLSVMSVNGFLSVLGLYPCLFQPM